MFLFFYKMLYYLGEPVFNKQPFLPPLFKHMKFMLTHASVSLMQNHPLLYVASLNSLLTNPAGV